MTNLDFIKMMKSWLYNKARGKGGGGGSGGHGKLKMPTGPIRLLGAVQAYYKDSKKKEIRPRIVKLWKEEQGLVDNTGHLGIDEGLIPKLNPKEQEAVDAKILKEMDIGRRKSLVQKLYDREPQSVKDKIDNLRKSSAGVVETEGDLVVRYKRLQLIDE